MLEQWLRARGLEGRLPAFLAERITVGDLPYLTDDDLRQLGLSMAERGRFRRVIAELLQPTDSTGRLTQAKLTALVQGERRPLTVMFVDIVDFVGLGEQVGDEEMLDVIRRFREVSGVAIARTGGRITKFLGDGMLACFCHPVASENDPQRAVRAGLEIAAAVSVIRPCKTRELAVRIGIATGSVILSDLFEGGEPELRSVTGSALNLAARLQALAPAGGVVMSESTHQRVAHLFSSEDLGLRQIRGLKDAVRCWRVRGEVEGRGGLAGGVAALPIHGREPELEILDVLWRNVAKGVGKAALLTGEAGVGKTALVEEFVRRHGLPDAAVVSLFGSELDIDAPFHPIALHLRARAGKGGVETLRHCIGGLPGDANETLALVARVAGLPFDGARLSGLSLPQQRDRTLEALSEILLTPAGNGPLCLIAEDLHWMDPSTIELLARLIDRLDHQSLLLLMTARLEFEAPWPGQGVVTLSVGRLNDGEVRAMAADLIGTLDIPAALVAQIVERTDGVPLFVQEVVRRLHDRSQQAGPSAWGDLDAQDVPSSLQEALMGRLDRTGSAKGNAQAASVIGRRMDRALLHAVVDMETGELDRCLETLVDGGVLRRDGGIGDGFSFSHALVREIAYGSLLRDARRRLHGRVADALKLLHPTIAEDQPATMAAHLTEAGRAGAAGRLWLEAGRRALEASALTEATRLLRRGLAAIATAEPSPERTRLELELLGLLGPALMSVSGPGAADTCEHYDRSYALCQTLDEEPAHFPLYWGWWRVAENFHTMASRSSWLLHRAKSHQDPGVLLQAHHCNWATSYHVGDFGQCCEHIEAGLGLYGDADWRHHAPLYGNHDARACAHGELALLHYMQGRPDGGWKHQRHSLAWARELRHLGSLMHSMDVGLTFHAMRRSHADVWRASEELTAFTTEHGFRDHAAKGRIYRGWARAVQEDAAGGLLLLQEGMSMQRDSGTSEDSPIYVCLLAEALMTAGQPETAVLELLAAREQFARIGLRVWLPEVLRMTAAAMAASSGSIVFPVLEEAAQVAAQQAVPMLGLRIANDRAKLLAEAGDPEAAEAILTAALAALPSREGVEFSGANARLAKLRGRLRRPVRV